MGGYLLSFTGMSIAWMIGSFIVAGILSIFRPKWSGIADHPKGLQVYWRNIGQCILGIELGQKINASVLHIFSENWLIILVMLLLSVAFSVLSGFVVWRYGKTDIVTSFFGTAPGGLSAMPSIAEEVGANTVIVGILQTIRILLVIGMIPLIISFWSPGHLHILDLKNFMTSYSDLYGQANEGKTLSYMSTVVLVAGALGGYLIGKSVKLPAPWLVGSMLGVCFVHSLCTFYMKPETIAWWPHWLINLSQIFIGASIGSRLNQEMFTKTKKVIFIGMLSSLVLIFSIFFLALCISEIAGIDFITSLLAFAPGGIAEMATLSVLLHADSGFVMVVQVLRIIIVLLVLPSLFKIVMRISS